MLEQLRAVPVPRETHSIVHDQSADGLKVPLYGDGGNIRDWIHVEDHNRAVQVVLEKGEIGEVYNIGAHNEITNREITYRLLDLCGRDESFIEPVADRLGHDRRYSVDIDRISALGWKLTRDFETGLAETVDWYKSPRLVGTAEGTHFSLAIGNNGAMRLLVTGAGGQLGHDVAAHCSSEETMFGVSHAELDVTQRDHVHGR